MRGRGRINRYIMECKFRCDTKLFFQIIELIDTLWNVNMLSYKSVQDVPRINRYIMECKLHSGQRSLSLYSELIDTLWNVNTSAAEEPSGDAQN